MVQDGQQEPPTPPYRPYPRWVTPHPSHVQHIGMHEHVPSHRPPLNTCTAWSYRAMYPEDNLNHIDNSGGQWACIVQSPVEEALVTTPRVPPL